MKLVKVGLILSALLTAISSFAAIDALEFKSAQQERDYHSLTQELRCPQCQNNNIADSNATIAVDMRAKVFELLNEGRSKDDIVNYMVERYGNFVTYDPPLTPATLWLWLLPLCFVVLGGFFVFRRKTSSAESAVKNSAVFDSVDLSAEEEKRLQSLLDKKD